MQFNRVTPAQELNPLHDDLALIGCSSAPRPLIEAIKQANQEPEDHGLYLRNARRLLHCAETAEETDFVARIIAPIAGAVSLAKSDLFGQARHEANKALQLLRAGEIPAPVRAVAASRVCGLAASFAARGSVRHSVELLAQAHNEARKIAPDGLRKIANSRLFRGSAEFALAALAKENFDPLNVAIHYLISTPKEDLDYEQSSVAIGAIECCTLADEIAQTQPGEAANFMEIILTGPLAYPCNVIFADIDSSPYLTLAHMYVLNDRVEEAYGILKKWLSLYEDVDQTHPGVYRHHLAYFADVCRKLDKHDEASGILTANLFNASLYEDDSADSRMRALERQAAEHAITSCKFNEANRILFSALKRPGVTLHPFVELRQLQTIVAKRLGNFPAAIQIFEETEKAIDVHRSDDPKMKDACDQADIVFKSEHAILLAQESDLAEASELAASANGLFRNLQNVSKTGRLEASFARWKAFGEIELQKENYDRAETYFTRALRMEKKIIPTEVSFIYRRLAETFLKRGLIQKAQEALDSAQEAMTGEGLDISVEAYQLCMSHATLARAESNPIAAEEWEDKAEQIQQQVQDRNESQIHFGV